jgi:hypothetical protein
MEQSGSSSEEDGTYDAIISLRVVSTVIGDDNQAQGGPTCLVVRSVVSLWLSTGSRKAALMRSLMMRVNRHATAV